MAATQETNDVGLGATAVIRLVADREIRIRLRSRAWRITTLVLMLLVVGFAVVMQLVGSYGSSKQVGFMGDTDKAAPRVEAIAKSLGTDVEPVRVTDESDGRRQLADGDLDALVLGSRGPARPGLRVLVKEELDDDLRTALTGAAGQEVLDDQISRLGGDPAGVEAEVAKAGVAVTSLEPTPKFEPQRLAVGSIAGILIYLALVTTGQMVAVGVVEEKASRVVELLLATIRPWQLMAGKVLGIGAVGLLQVAAVGIAGVLAGELSGALDLSLSASVGVVAWLVVWFVLGFTLYALVFAGLAALVSRQEDVGGVTAPATILLVVGYVVGIAVLPSAPGNSVVATLSMLPVFSPTLMPMRLAMGGVPVWQSLLSLLLALATVPLLVMLAARLYRNGVIRSGARVGLLEALRRDAAG